MQMKKIYYLANCDTCQKILKEVGAEKKNVELQDIKSAPLTPTQLDDMKALAGSYEVLFSRRALKYRAMGLHQQTLNEKDYRRLILEEYTFLKRPVAIIQDQIFIGNSKAVVEALKNIL